MKVVQMKAEEKSEVELTSLIGGVDPGGEHADFIADDSCVDLGKGIFLINLPSRIHKDVGEVAKALSSGGGGGYGARDVLLFVLSFLFGILGAVLMFALVADVGTTARVPWSEMRWQPISTNDNCIPRFRLANATIHCGVDDLAPITVTSSGTQYCGGVRMEPNYCVMPTEGRWMAPLRLGGGVASIPLPHRLGVYSNNTLPRCKSIETFINGSYEGEGFDQEWRPSSCSAVPLSPFALTQNAKCEATIIMMGDSHIRNLFTATVNGLRGVNAFAEAHADDAMKNTGIIETYEWKLQKDTAVDKFAVYADTKSNEPHLFDDCQCSKKQRCLRIAFIWAPTFHEQEEQMHLISKWRSSIVIAEPGNAYEPDLVLSTTWTAKIDELLENDPALQLGILHFPYGKQPAERMDAVFNWTTNGMYAERKSFLQQSAMAQPVGGMQGRKTWHYTCGLGRVDVENDSITAAEPCTDITDTAHTRAFLTVHFDAL